MPVLACVDWTNNWEHAFVYTSEKQAKRDRDYLGLSLAKVVEYGVYPPPVPKEEPSTVTEKWNVYFISERQVDQGQGYPYIKIGYSKDPQKRLKQLQTGHPKKLGLEGWKVCETEEEARAIEHSIHKFFEKNRTNGEWFKLTPAVSAYIDLLHKEDETFVRFFS